MPTDTPSPARLRIRLVLLRFWQPTSACLTCMPGNLANVVSLPHWEIALRTGLATGLLVLLLSFTPLLRLFRHPAGNAAMVGVLTALGDAYSHPDHYGHGAVEPILTGFVSALFALIAGLLLEDRARRLRHAWSRLRGTA